MGALFGVAMVVVGATVVIPIFGPFGVLWTFFAIVMTAYHGFNALSGEGFAHEVVDVSIPSHVNEVASATHSDAPDPSPADRLRDLQQLMDEGLISEEEFATEKARILRSI